MVLVGLYSVHRSRNEQTVGYKDGQDLQCFNKRRQTTRVPSHMEFWELQFIT